MSFSKLLKLATKFETKYLVSKASPDNNMSMMAGAADAMYQLSLYLQELPNPNYNVINNGATFFHDFNTYFRAIVDNLSEYYDVTSKQYTPLYNSIKAQQREIPGAQEALIKKTLLQAKPSVSGIGSVIWYNTKDPAVKNAINDLVSIVTRNAEQITPS